MHFFGERLGVSLDACALVRAMRRALAFAHRCRLGLDVAAALAWAAATSCVEGPGASASSTGARGCTGVHCGGGNNLQLECYARPPLRCQAQEWTAAVR